MGDMNPEKPEWDLQWRVRLMNPVQECASQPGAQRSSACLALLHWIIFLAFADASHDCFPAPCNLGWAHSAMPSYLESYESVFPLFTDVFQILVPFPGKCWPCHGLQSEKGRTSELPASFNSFSTINTAAWEGWRKIKIMKHLQYEWLLASKDGDSAHSEMTLNVAIPLLSLSMGIGSHQEIYLRVVF